MCNFIFKCIQQLNNLFPGVAIALASEHCKHFFKLIETDELVFAMKFIDADQTAQPSRIALLVETNHDDFLVAMGLALLAVVLVFFEVHFGLHKIC
jgi:hypothetical protein